MARGDVTQKTFQCLTAQGSRVDTVHAGELSRLQRLVLQDPLIHLQRLRGHGQAQAGRVIRAWARSSAWKRCGARPAL